MNREWRAHCSYLCLLSFRFHLQKIERFHFHFTFDCKCVDVYCDSHHNEYESKRKIHKRRGRERVRWRENIAFCVDRMVEVMHEFKKNPKITYRQNETKQKFFQSHIQNRIYFILYWRLNVVVLLLLCCANDEEKE